MTDGTEPFIAGEVSRQPVDEITKYKIREGASATADKVLMDISLFIGAIQLTHRSTLTETPGIYMEFRLNNLRFSYTDRRTDVVGSGTLDVSSVGEYRIISFVLDVAHEGLTVEQINRIEKADHDASWAGYGDNLVKYADCPQRLKEIYPQDVLDALETELLGTAVTVDFFGGEEGGDADVLNISAYRILSDYSGVTSQRIGQPDRDAVVIHLAERFPQLRHLFGGSDDTSA